MTNHTVTIAAELVCLSFPASPTTNNLIGIIQENNRTLVGQCNISHPVRPDPASFSFTLSPCVSELDDGNSPESVHGVGNLDYTKEEEEDVPLEARIRRMLEQLFGVSFSLISSCII